MPNANVHLKLIRTTAAEFTLALAGYSYLASSCVWLCHQYGIENSQWQTLDRLQTAWRHTHTVSQSQLVVCIGQIQLTRKQTSRRQPKIPPRVREPRVVLSVFVCVMCVTLQCRGGTLASVACSYFSAPTDSHPRHTGAVDTPTRSRHGQALDTKLRMQCLLQQRQQQQQLGHLGPHVIHLSGSRAGGTDSQTSRLRPVTGHTPMAFLTVYLHERSDYAP